MNASASTRRLVQRAQLASHVNRAAHRGLLAPAALAPRPTAPRRRWEAGHRRLAGVVRAAASERHSSAGSPRQAGQPEELVVLILAGFYIEELATVRQLLDEAGGDVVRVVPSSPALLHLPLREALRAPEPQWDQPVPDDWLHGGGWGQQRMVLTHGIDEEGQQLLLDLLEEAAIPEACPALATPDNLGATLGEVLAAALKQHRAGGSSSGGGGGGSAGAAAVAAAPVAPPFVDQLPRLEEVVPESVWHPPAGAGTGGGARQAPGARSAPEIVMAEFAEAQQVQQADVAAAVPLDVIDAIAGSGSGTGSSSSTTRRVASKEAAGAAADAAEEQQQPLHSEQLLAAARQALGLDSADLQRLVDEAAAKAAAAMDVPFLGGSSNTAAAAAGATTQAAPAPAPASPRSTVGSKKPWEADVATGGAAAAGGSTLASKGFGTGVVSRKQAKGSDAAAAAARKAGRSKPVPGSSRSNSGGSAAGQGTAADSSQQKGGSSAGAAAAAASAASQATGEGRAAAEPEGAPDTAASSDDNSGEAAAEDLLGSTLPGVDQFVLSKAQLKSVTDKHGLDFEQLLAGLQERGIPLAD